MSTLRHKKSKLTDIVETCAAPVDRHTNTLFCYFPFLTGRHKEMKHGSPSFFS